jgi:hypothetical protein
MWLLRVKVSISVCQSVCPSDCPCVLVSQKYGVLTIRSSSLTFLVSEPGVFLSNLFCFWCYCTLLMGRRLFFPVIYLCGSKWLRLVQHYVNFHYHACVRVILHITNIRNKTYLSVCIKQRIIFVAITQVK